MLAQPILLDTTSDPLASTTTIPSGLPIHSQPTPSRSIPKKKSNKSHKQPTSLPLHELDPDYPLFLANIRFDLASLARATKHPYTPYICSAKTHFYKSSCAACTQQQDLRSRLVAVAAIPYDGPADPHEPQESHELQMSHESQGSPDRLSRADALAELMDEDGYTVFEILEARLLALWDDIKRLKHARHWQHVLLSHSLSTLSYTRSRLAYEEELAAAREGWARRTDAQRAAFHDRVRKSWGEEWMAGLREMDEGERARLEYEEEEAEYWVSWLGSEKVSRATEVKIQRRVERVSGILRVVREKTAVAMGVVKGEEEGVLRGVFGAEVLFGGYDEVGDEGMEFGCSDEEVVEALLKIAKGRGMFVEDVLVDVADGYHVEDEGVDQEDFFLTMLEWWFKDEVKAFEEDRRTLGI